MPCRTDPPTQSEIRDGYEREFTHNSDLAEIFCATMITIEQHDNDIGGHGTPIMEILPARTLKWWNDHKKRDRDKVNAERKEMERKQAISVALSKLTPGERKLLGVKTS